MKDSKIKVTIDEENLGKEIHELVISKVKHLLRNDAELVDLIDKTIDHEVNRKINARMIFIDKKYIDDLILGKIDLQYSVIDKMITKKIMSLLKKVPAYQELLSLSNTQSLEELFKEEITNIKNGRG